MTNEVLTGDFRIAKLSLDSSRHPLKLEQLPLDCLDKNAAQMISGAFIGVELSLIS